MLGSEMARTTKTTTISTICSIVLCAIRGIMFTRTVINSSSEPRIRIWTSHLSIQVQFKSSGFTRSTWITSTKITHTPELQARIIEAASNPGSVGRELEALMFSIYCMAVTSLRHDQCQNLFGSAKDSLLTGYQFACQQALAKCEFLRTRDRDCLTALYLYLVSQFQARTQCCCIYLLSPGGDQRLYYRDLSMLICRSCVL